MEDYFWSTFVRKIFVFSLIRITTATSHHLLFHEESAKDNAEVLVDLMYWFTLPRPPIYSRCAEDACHDILVCYLGLVLLLSSLFSLLSSLSKPQKSPTNTKLACSKSRQLSSLLRSAVPPFCPLSRIK